MKAIVYDRYGSPDVMRIEEVDQPDVPDDAVLVRVRATSINAHDWHLLRGKPYLARLSEGLRRPKERILGLDVAGEVEQVGANVTDLAVGDRVFGTRSGAFAEYVASRNMVPMPSSLTFEQAAAIPVAGQTALQGLRDRGQLQPGQRVLVNGAGGGVGTMAVQIAKALGAHVTAVTNGDSLDTVRSIGADAVIDYRREDFTAGRDRYDLVLDIRGTQRIARLRRALTPRGRVVMVAPQPGQWIGPIVRVVGAVITNKLGRPRVIPFLSSVSRDDLLYLARLVEEGSLRPVICRTYPFEQIPEAIRHMETSRVRGKIAITV